MDASNHEPKNDDQRLVDHENQEFTQQFTEVSRDIYGFIERRLSAKMRRRMDASDIVQETQLAALQRYEQFQNDSRMPFRIWILLTAKQQLIHAYRKHLEAEKRTLDREIAWSDCSSVLLAKGLALSQSTPSQNLHREELLESVQAAIEDLQDIDREVLLMRQIENRPYEEIALLLDMQPEAARQRYGRALIKLRGKLRDLGLLEFPS